jgi:hypothetical protein
MSKKALDPDSSNTIALILLELSSVLPQQDEQGSAPAIRTPTTRTLTPVLLVSNIGGIFAKHAQVLGSNCCPTTSAGNISKAEWLSWLPRFPAMSFRYDWRAVRTRADGEVTHGSMARLVSWLHQLR